MQIPTKIAITITALILIVICSETFYNAIFVGNQLAYANITGTILTLLWYVFPIVGAITTIVLVWWRKKK